MGGRRMQGQSRLVPVWIYWEKGTCSSKQDGWGLLEMKSWRLNETVSCVYVLLWFVFKRVGEHVLSQIEDHLILSLVFDMWYRYQQFCFLPIVMWIPFTSYLFICFWLQGRTWAKSCLFVNIANWFEESFIRFVNIPFHCIDLSQP